MPTSTALREQRANVWSQMTEILDRAETEARELTADERQTYDTAEADLDRIEADLARQERHEKRANLLNSVDRTGVVVPGQRDPASPEDEYRAAFRDYLRFGAGNLRQEQQQVLARGFVNDPAIQNAQGVGTGTAGGYTVPAEFRDELIRYAKEFGSVLSLAQVIETDSGANLPWPTVDDTNNEGVILGENTQVTEQDASLGQNSLDAYVITSKLTRVSLQLIQDSAVDPENLVVSLHGERIGRGMNRYLTTGTGTNQPDGIVTGAATGVTAASATAIAADELIDLQHSVDPAYRNERSRFMLTDTALKSVRKLKDSTGAYLWQPSLREGVPGTLLGSPYEINQHMPVPATGAKSVLYGDFRAGYVVRIVRNVQNVRFAERFMEFLQVGFMSFARFDGTVQNTNAYKALVQA